MTKSPNTLLFLALLCLSAAPLSAEEGMWLVNRFPEEAVAKAYGFQVTDAFLDRLRLGAVRFNSGGSGSFVSPRGLLFTNHHVAADCVQKLGTKEADLMANGFYAATEQQEKKCPDLEVNILVGLEDVTVKVKDGVSPDTPPAEANQKIKANTSRIEKDCTAATGSRCDVVTLFSGGEFHLYRYKKYTDVRLVFAPESDIGFFGGDPDNFTYPRYCLDVAFLRAYENGKPVEYPQDKELIFVPGHPGGSGRLRTLAQLEFSRNVSYPLALANLESEIGALQTYSAQSEENRRVAKDVLFSAENSFKAITGYLQGLRDPALMSRKKDEEQTLRAAVERDPARRQEFGGVWDQVAAAYKELAAFYKSYYLLEAAPNRSDLFHIARDVMRLATERTKPNEKRLPEYSDARLSSLELSLYSPAPITDSLQIVVLANYFRFLQEHLGTDDATVKAILDGKTPEKAAEGYISTSKVQDIAERKRLAADAQAVEKSEDGMLRLVRIMEGPARRWRKQYEDRVESVIRTAGARVALARFAISGSSAYPDATFTLRVTYAPVKGYRNREGKWIPWATDFAGLYRRATGQEPYRLPKRWLHAKASLKLATPFNFVSTADIHGGNSGSPTVNTRGEVVGIIFDSNIEALPNQFVYTDKDARAVHVAGQGIVEALRKVYKADRLLKELLP